MAAKTQRGDLMSLGWLALMDFSAADTQGVVYDYSNPVLTPPIMFGAQHKWVQGANGFWLPQTALDADGNSTCGPIGGWLRVPPGGHVRTQPQWAASPFLAQVQSVGPPLEVAVMKNSSGALETQLSDTFQATVMPGAATPNVNDWGLLVQPTRLDAQDPVWVPLKGGSASAAGGGSLWGDASDGNITLKQGSTGVTNALAPYSFDSFTNDAFHINYKITQSYFRNGANNGGFGVQFDPLTFNNGQSYFFLWAPLFAGILEIDTGVTLFTNGFPVFALQLKGGGTIDHSATIVDKINSGAFFPADPANDPQSALTTAFAPGGDATSLSLDATQQTTLSVGPSQDAGGATSSYAKGGAGGTGPGSGGNTVYALGDVGTPPTYAPSMGYRVFGGGYLIQIDGLGGLTGGQGGSAGSSGVQISGSSNGGAGGGFVVSNVRDMTLFTGLLSADGQNGRDGDSGGGVNGGGGGGSGGCTDASTDVGVTTSKTWSTSQAKGTGGTGHGGGGNGADGSVGHSAGNYP